MVHMNMLEEMREEMREGSRRMPFFCRNCMGCRIWRLHYRALSRISPAALHPRALQEAVRNRAKKR